MGQPQDKENIGTYMRKKIEARQEREREREREREALRAKLNLG